MDHNLTLARTRRSREFLIRAFRWPLCAEDEQIVARELATHYLRDFFVLNPGGGWRSKCWPAKRYGELHRRLSKNTAAAALSLMARARKIWRRQLIAAAGENPRRLRFCSASVP